MKKIIMILLLTVFSFSIFAMPAQILLIRHGEKPDIGSELSQQGWQRAKALPNMFERSEFLKFGLPVAFYAMSPQKKNGSVRAIQTLSFAAEKLKLPINKNFTRDEVSSLVRDIQENPHYNGKMVVICWEHKVLEDIAHAFGLKKYLDWPGKQYDRVWSLTFSSDSKSILFEDLPEKLLPTDSQK
jgi:hypothetical protein